MGQLQCNTLVHTAIHIPIVRTAGPCRQVLNDVPSMMQETASEPGIEPMLLEF